MTELEKVTAEDGQLQTEVVRLTQWVHDLQSGMYINCVYCGHHYGPEDEVPATMADALKEHIENCPQHPMSELKSENERLRDVLKPVIARARKAVKDLGIQPPSVFGMFLKWEYVVALAELEAVVGVDDG